MAAERMRRASVHAGGSLYTAASIGCCSAVRLAACFRLCTCTARGKSHMPPAHFLAHPSLMGMSGHTPAEEPSIHNACDACVLCTSQCMAGTVIFLGTNYGGMSGKDMKEDPDDDNLEIGAALTRRMNTHSATRHRPACSEKMAQ